MAASLFDIAEEVPEADPAWRAPTTGEHVCRTCRGAACYGLGEAWFCRRHAPADFLPSSRRAAR